MNFRNTTNIETQYCLQIYFPFLNSASFLLNWAAHQLSVSHKLLSDKVNTHKYHHPTHNHEGLGQFEFSFSQDTHEFPLLRCKPLCTTLQFDVHRWVKENWCMYMESFQLVCCGQPQKSPATPLNPLILLLYLILLHKYPLEAPDSTCCHLKTTENSLYPENQEFEKTRWLKAITISIL